MPELDPNFTVSLLPPGGRWAVGVSGGADSVALLWLLHARADLTIHVVHLDHQTRGAESTADAEFVRSLSGVLGVPFTVVTRSDVESRVRGLPRNRSARFRALRLSLFTDVLSRHALDGVALAHHADDVAETVLHRLLRGSSAAGLTGIEARTTIGGLTVVRPLLDFRREALHAYLRSIGQTWREDSSNASPCYARNRLRSLLAATPELTGPLLNLAAATARLRTWTRSAAPALPEPFTADALAGLPDVLARPVGSSRVDLQACKLEYSIVSPK